MPRDDSFAERFGATGAWFTTTHWSVVWAARQSDSAESVEAWEKLCRAYWAPLYAYIRHRGHGIEEAQDLTQEFFRRLMLNSQQRDRT
jgi:RNA polymerase sigma-70 factor (ECF subfamily)